MVALVAAQQAAVVERYDLTATGLRCAVRAHAADMTAQRDRSCRLGLCSPRSEKGWYAISRYAIRDSNPEPAVCSPGSVGLMADRESGSTMRVSVPGMVSVDDWLRPVSGTKRARSAGRWSNKFTLAISVQIHQAFSDTGLSPSGHSS
jgi:hypothetical protein